MQKPASARRPSGKQCLYRLGILDFSSFTGHKRLLHYNNSLAKNGTRQSLKLTPLAEAARPTGPRRTPHVPISLLLGPLGLRVEGRRQPTLSKEWLQRVFLEMESHQVAPGTGASAPTCSRPRAACGRSNICIWRKRVACCTSQHSTCASTKHGCNPVTLRAVFGLQIAHVYIFLSRIKRKPDL